jgi:dnd system-associated protein 4
MDAPNKGIFILAMALGFSKGKKTPIKKPYTGHVNYISLTPEERWLLRAIAISEKKDLSVLSGDNQKEIFRIAEEYANGGIKLLYQEIKGEEFGDFIKRLESDLKSSLAT